MRKKQKPRKPLTEAEIENLVDKASIVVRVLLVEFLQGVLRCFHVPLSLSSIIIAEELLYVKG